MQYFLRTILLFIVLTVPTTLYSTDIYISSHEEVKIHTSINSHIIPGDTKLGNTLLVVSAPDTKEDIHVVGNCTYEESILYRTPMQDAKTLYIIRLVFPSSCDTPEIRIGDDENVFTDTLTILPIESLDHMENSLIDTESSELLGVMRVKNKALPVGKEVSITEKLKRVQILYQNFDISLKSDIARGILQDREYTKYLSPVAGYTLPNSSSLIPGAGRSYRRDTTDGIHHGWDIMAPYGTPVQSLAKGKVIRIVDNWSWADFKRLKKGTLTPDDELRNLDIYRGNQIWLQTMDGNVTFYSHLSALSSDLHVGNIVEAGTRIGSIGTSGVPDKNYKDVHLHFEIQKNPFREDMKTPTPLDIMRWDYIGEHMSANEVRTLVRGKFDQNSSEIAKR